MEGTPFPLDVRIIGERLFVVVDHTGERFHQVQKYSKLMDSQFHSSLEELTKYVSGEKLSYRIIG